jgi:sialate O-acetylesterase
MKLLLLIALLVPGLVSAAVKPHPLFSDNALLQCDLPVPVWGTADPGEKVTVTFAGQTVTATADAQGRWRATLQPLQPSATPQTMTITGSNTVAIKNLLVGEVWLCSGQSNMQWVLKNTENSQAAIDAAADPLLRLFTVQGRATNQPAHTIEGRWAECSSASAAGFSAVGYYFGRDLRRALQRPVGLINASVGGTAAELWTARGTLEADAELRAVLAAHEKAVANYPKALADYKAKEAELLKKYEADVAAAKAAGKPAPRKPAPPKNPADAGPASLYNGLIAPLQPFALRGVIWYQGESNNGRAEQYKKLFPAMIRGWREAWGQGDFPFLFVQIAPYQGMSPEIREAQLVAWQKTPKTAMVVTTDCGDAKDIHPKRKEPVGQRLALAARAIAYGENIEYSGPVIESIKIDGHKAVLNFTHVGAGLEARGGELTGFKIAGADKKFLPATATITGKQVIVFSPEVAAPVAVSYGWAPVPEVNLYNSAGLPATPFRISVASP